MTHDSRLMVTLSPPETAALLAMSRHDCRHPREQLRYLLREAAYTRGLLQSKSLSIVSHEKQDEHAVENR